MSNREIVEISDDDDSFEVANTENKIPVSEISSDEEHYELPDLNLTSRKNAIKKLFPTQLNNTNIKSKIKHTINSESYKPVKYPNISKEPGVVITINNVKVNFPVNPYSSQVALMNKEIKAITNNQNCLLESPTGSGKTLALLCAALAVQRKEKLQLSEKQAQNYYADHPELSKLHGASEFIASPKKNNLDNAENFFTTSASNNKTIYSTHNSEASSSSKRQEPLNDSSEGDNGLVTVHKKPRLGSSSNDMSPHLPSTPEKKLQVKEPSTPEDVRVPTIYYGARTHKQIEQVVKEFARTVYSGEAAMTVLSSREYSCIREFDRHQWSSKNDMCRGCVKTFESNKKDSSNCLYHNNRKLLNHRTLPAVFDLEDLVNAGKEKQACPYYAAREMATAANIIFCPYNYLIEPSIRSSMQIDVSDNIVIIDEGHNIEDVCRDAATITITRTNITAAITELQKVSQYRYENQDSMGYIEHLLKVLSNWDQWFVNQMPLINNRPVNNDKAEYTWVVEHFLNTLENHTIGLGNYSEFRDHAEMFCRRLREDPRTLMGVSQSTGTLVENINTLLGYLFRDGGRHIDDFVPTLERTEIPDISRRNFKNNHIDKEELCLRLICMNPAVVFEALKPARSIIIASGTLAPLISMHSELGTKFPLEANPRHIISSDRVWIGSLSTCPDGSPLQCIYSELQQVHIQDALGKIVVHVCSITPSGVLCFLPSYWVMNKLITRWQDTGIWNKLESIKNVFQEGRNVRDHNDIMEDYYECAASSRGALLFAVYRGKVSEGMDFKDHQARAVIAIGIPYPNTFETAVKEKMKYNDKYQKERNLLKGREWLQVQAFRPLNQAVGRCVRHRMDWGAVLLVDGRFRNPQYSDQLSKWVREYLNKNHHTFESLLSSANSLESFMQHMKIQETEDT
ncbi:Fanconi anemia group J protein homolog isoform X2 [Pieris napi]|uniref:Fanconi anemia group J protein homolog isoform X2 n=1 Tax=Pieris napi TaxID=78633 RepID=UPI001FBB7953|nr:Fanconi anemia group J protein homolog isoform X2 [Pieris napi]